MPSKDDIDKAIKNIKKIYEYGGNMAPIRDAMTLIAAYREELYKSIGVKEFEDGK